MPRAIQLTIFKVFTFHGNWYSTGNIMILLVGLQSCWIIKKYLDFFALSFM